MEELVKKNICSNCNYSPVDYLYCPNCGQKKLNEKDLRLIVLVGDVMESIFNFDNAFFRTLKLFFLNPGKYVTSYNVGERKKYISPIKWFLIANAIYFLFPYINTFTTSLQIQLNGLIYSDFTRGWIEALISSSELDSQSFHIQYNELTKTLSKVFLLILPLMFSGLTFLTNYSERKNKPLLFHINRSLILFSFLLLVVLCSLPFIYTLFSNSSQIVINDKTITITSFVLLNIYGFFLYKGFFKAGLVKNIARVILLNFAFYILIFTYRFILLLITLGWMLFF
ncbi:MAG TPA: hypothetical protein DCL80_09615 [Balneola sp.]|mgnify:CR=1 FL=1|jgi:RNA polymerase subunit RPABC4/transcription elongation factor Spt4|nr:hypothetical protein [Balneola sp.]MBF63852.1 hypothetical protein [Balneola sp.]HAH51494.1 hypothetical protein [Balneola sp.]HAW78302.1 hypothetical protein [Balneola sp.]HBZ37926.1 hypothetical protein [Balneola sp.]|tara:strand:+ start:4932 stop:5780 length:849 start_codon:yes stop_codon:yes gene_type:complete